MGEIKHWISCKVFTVTVTEGPDGKIIEAAPIVKAFIGQKVNNLVRWARLFPNFRHEITCPTCTAQLPATGVWFNPESKEWECEECFLK